MGNRFCIEYVEIEHCHRAIPERFYLNDEEEVDEYEVYRKMNGVIIMNYRYSGEKYDRFVIKYNTDGECDVYRRVKQLFYVIFNACLKIDYDEITGLIETVSYAIGEMCKDERSLRLLTGIWNEIEERQKNMGVCLEEIFEEMEE